MVVLLLLGLTMALLVELVLFLSLLLTLTVFFVVVVSLMLILFLPKSPCWLTSVVDSATSSFDPAIVGLFELADLINATGIFVKDCWLDRGACE